MPKYEVLYTFLVYFVDLWLLVKNVNISISKVARWNLHSKLEISTASPPSEVRRSTTDCEDSDVTTSLSLQ